MFTVDFDLSCLTAEELLEARARLHDDGEAVERYDPYLAHLFEALRHALYARRADLLARDERHTLADALAIDEETGEWDAGA